MDINQIKAQIPHRYPFLLVDRIVEIEVGKRAVGLKNISVNEFYGHQVLMNGETVFPGSLQVEAMAQVSAFAMTNMLEDSSKIALLTSIEKARFHKMVRPGDQLRIEVELKKFKINIGKFDAYSYINDELASEVSFTCAVVDNNDIM